MKITLKIDDRSEGMVTRRESEQKPMKEGDYLRQHISLDDIEDDSDEKPAGCLSLRPRSSTLDSETRRRSTTDCEAKPTRIAEKLRRIFSARRDQSVAQSLSSKTAPGRKSPTSHVVEPPRRRFMRVVKDENAPPPERIGDNPNIICRYSQEFLTKHYADKERTRHLTGEPKPALPYTTSGHTILKKSSTDPTSDRPFDTAPSATLKHTTFRDMVTVFDVVVGEMHEEKLHEDSVDCLGNTDDNDSTPQPSGFFLDSTDGDVDTGVELAETVTAFEDFNPSTDVSSKTSDFGAKRATNSLGMMSVFSSAATDVNEVNDQSSGMGECKAVVHSTKRVNLEHMMAQIRSSTGAGGRHDEQ